jgi:hypothetical protein
VSGKRFKIHHFNQMTGRSHSGLFLYALINLRHKKASHKTGFYSVT